METSKDLLQDLDKEKAPASQWVQVSEWDSIAEEPVTLVLDAGDYDRRLTDPEAALRIAESIQEQQPELLELIAEYMAVADELGSEEARAWLRDYYEVDDQRCHPYV